MPGINEIKRRQLPSAESREVEVSSPLLKLLATSIVTSTVVWQRQAIRIKRQRHQYSISLLIQEEQYENWHVLYDHAYAGVFGLIVRRDRYDQRLLHEKVRCHGQTDDNYRLHRRKRRQVDVEEQETPRWRPADEFR